MRLNYYRVLSLTFHCRSSQNTVNTTVDATYHVKEAIVHAIDVRFDSLKEGSSLRSCICENNTTVQTSQVVLEILDNLSWYLDASYCQTLTSHSIQLVRDGACQNSRDSTGTYWYPPNGASITVPLARVDLDSEVGG